MIPILYTSNELSFTSNGIGRLADCVSCTVTEERNGIYECELQYPITGRFYQQMITSGGIIGVYHDDRHDVQPFDIYGFSAPINGIVTFYAHHISYRLASVILKPFTASSVAEVMVRIPQYSYNNNPFTFWTDKQTAANFNLDVPNCVRAILGGQQGSILDTFGGGDYEFDKFSVKLYDDRGTDKGVTIRYGKNLSDITYDKDNSGRYNAIAPYWKDGNGNVVYLPEIYVFSPNDAGSQLAPWTNESGEYMTDNNLTVIEFNYVAQLPVAKDFSEYFQEQPTVDQLRQRALQFLNTNRPWLPNENVKVDFLQLWQTPEYENVAALQRVALCDYVSVYYPELGVVKEQQKVIKTVYNVLLERFDSMEIGKPTTTLAQQIVGTAETETEAMLSDFKSVMQSAINKATDLITGGLGGYVVFNLNAEGQPQEILIMDTPDIATAVNVIRMNRNGIGFSTSGYEGPFASAWTIDGAFNADFITAGTINANIIKAGILSDYAGLNSWNLLTGDMVLSGEINLHKIYGSGSSLNDYYANIGQVTYKKVSYFYQEAQTYTHPGFQIYNARDTAGTTTSKFSVIALPGYASGERRAGTIRLASESLYSIDDDEGRMDIIYQKNPATGEERTTEVSFSHALLMAHIKVLPTYAFMWEMKVDETGIKSTHNGMSSATALNVDIKEARIWIRNANYELQLYSGGFEAYAKNSGGSLTYGINIKSNVQTVNNKQIAFSSSSSRRYKHDVERLTDKDLNPHKLLSLPVRQFVYNEDFNRLQYPDMEGKLLPGFIAEEVDEIYPSAVIHNQETGEVESWDERRLIPGMIALIQEQQKRIDDLEARLAKLERMVETLC